MYNLRAAAAVFSVGLFVIYGVIVFQLRRPLMEGYSDFVSFYTAGKILERGLPKQLYDIGLQREIQLEVAPNVRIRQGALPFVRPAFEAWIFWPLAHLPYGPAFLLWNAFNCACLILTVLGLHRAIPELHSVSPVLVVASSLTYFPVFFTILQGQDSVLLLFVYVMGYRALRHDRQFLAGTTLGLGIFKFPLLIPFLLAFAVKRRLRVVLGFALTSLVLSGVSIATVGLSTALYYPKYLRAIDSIARGVNRPQDMPNLRGMLAVLLPMLSSRTGALLLVALSILVLVCAIRKWTFDSSHHRPAFTLGLALNVVATVLVSYHCHVFDLCILLLPIGLVLGMVLSDEPIAPQMRRLLMWVLCAVMFSPLYLLVTFPLRTPSFLGWLLVALACAIGLTISDPRRGPIME
jgi:uncharacterized membrane protein YidH (DUF202 family)